MAKGELTELPNNKNTIKLTEEEIAKYENSKTEDPRLKEIPDIFYSILDKAIYGKNSVLVHLVSDGHKSGLTFRNTAEGIYVNKELVDSFDINPYFISSIKRFLMTFVLNAELFDSLDEDEKEVDELSYLIYILEDNVNYKYVSAIHIKGEIINFVPIEDLEKMCAEDQNVIPKTNKKIKYSLYE